MHEIILFVLSTLAFIWGMVFLISQLCKEEFPHWFNIGGVISILVPFWLFIAYCIRGDSVKTYTTDVHIQYNVPFAYNENNMPFLLNDEALIMKNPKVKVTYVPAGWYFGVKCERVFQFEVVESLDTPEKIL